MNEFIKNLKTPIAIIGMGRSGDAAKRLLMRAGLSTQDVISFDSKQASADFCDPQALMEKAGPRTLVVSPGVPLSSPWILEAKNNGVQITSEISLAASCLTVEKVIGVTGSVGKSTTVSILGAGLESFSKNGFVGGNLGTPFSEYALGVLENSRPVADWVVLELSSYQLENCEGLELDYSAITYLTSNHLERYRDIAHYYDTKWLILSHTRGGSLLLNKEGGDLVEYYMKNKLEPQVRIISRHDSDIQNLRLDKAFLIGQHNQDNLALAAGVALSAGWPLSAISGMKNFRGLAHRLENLGEINGIRFINDSKATAMDSVLIAVTAAFDTLQGLGKLVVLLGGRDKNLPWQELNKLKHFKDLQIIFFGECGSVAQNKSGLPGPRYQTLKTALEFSKEILKKEDTLLLSPGGTSLDEFKSFEDRGEFFKRWTRDSFIS